MSQLFKQIFSLLTSGERRQAAWLIVLMLIGMVLETLGVGLAIPVATLLMQENGGPQNHTITTILDLFGNPPQATVICWGMVVLVLAFIAKNLYLAFLMWRQGKFIYGVQNNLSQRLFATYLAAPYAFHLRRNSAQLIANTTTEVFQYSTAFTAITLLMTEGLVIVGIASLLIYVQPVGALVNMLGLGAASWAFFHFTKSRSARWGALRQKHDALRVQHLQQGLGSAKDIKLLGREKVFFDLFRTHDCKSAEMNRKQATLQQLPRFWLEILSITALAIVVITMILQGKTPAQIVPTIGLFAAAAFRLMPSVSRLLYSAQMLKYSQAGINLLHAEFQMPCDLEATGKPALPIRTFESEIRVENLSFSYHGTEGHAVREISLVIKKGELVGFTGTSGSGKSTLIDIVLGLLTPTSGRVLVDGRDIQSSLRAWQDQIGYVPQSIYLTDDTLRRNIAFGLPPEQIDDAAVDRAIKASQLDELIAGLPDGAETLVGERGIRLSGGQRQRIGIARALYHDPSVLVLDEATSALDGETEKCVMEAVNSLHGRKTILIIAHRLSTVQNCDRIFRLEQGKLAAQGTPDVMLAAGDPLQST
ncbi:MAG: ABC transporter ATP-binding protein [Terrimicrobiaceae bacterium]